MDNKNPQPTSSDEKIKKVIEDRNKLIADTLQSRKIPLNKLHAFLAIINSVKEWPLSNEIQTFEDIEAYIDTQAYFEPSSHVFHTNVRTTVGEIKKIAEEEGWISNWRAMEILESIEQVAAHTLPHMHRHGNRPND